MRAVSARRCARPPAGCGLHKCCRLDKLRRVSQPSISLRCLRPLRKTAGCLHLASSGLQSAFDLHGGAHPRQDKNQEFKTKYNELSRLYRNRCPLTARSSPDSWQRAHPHEGVSLVRWAKPFVTQDDNSCVICAAGVARTGVSVLSHERKLLRRPR